MIPSLLKDAINNLKKLPGIGERSALRQVLTILRWDPSAINSYAESVRNLINLKKCNECGLLIDDTCPICNSTKRENGSICIVENISDFLAIEKSGRFNGIYHILGGVLSPIMGVSPDTLEIPKLIERIKRLNIKEVILAINPSMEGDATSSYIKMLLPEDILVERIGLGIPMGSNLEYFDSLTISKALENRKAL